MNEEKTCVQELKEILEQLHKNSSLNEILELLSKANNLISDLANHDITNFNDLMKNYLKPLSREVTNFNLVLCAEAKPTLETLIMGILKIYCMGALKAEESLAFELIEELVGRKSELFEISESMIESEENVLSKRQEIESGLEWVTMQKESITRNSFFYFRSMDNILKFFQQFQTEIPNLNLNFAKNLFNFILKNKSFIRTNKQSELCEKVISLIEQEISTLGSGKDQYKESFTDSIREVCKVAGKISEHCKNTGLRKTCFLLPSIYGLGLLGSSSIEKRMQGVKIINKEAENFYTTSFNCIKDADYCYWLVNNKALDFVLDISTQAPVIKHSNYIFRILFKRKFYNKSTADKIYDYIEQTSSENRQLLLKYLEVEIIKMDHSEYEMFEKKLRLPHPVDFYEEDTFNIASGMIRYSTLLLVKYYSENIEAILEEYYGKFKTEKIQERALKSYIKSLTYFIEKQLNIEEKKKVMLIIYDKCYSKIETYGLFVIKNVFEDLPSSYEAIRNKIGKFLIEQRNVIHTWVQYIKNPETKEEEKQIASEFLLSLLKSSENAKDEGKLEIGNEVLKETVDSPCLFEKFLPFVDNLNDLKSTYEYLLNVFPIQNIDFKMIRAVFYRMNSNRIKEVKNYNNVFHFEVKCQVKELDGIEGIKYLLLFSSNAHSRDQISDFLSDLYTNFEEERNTSGSEELEKLLKEVLLNTFEQYESKENPTKLLGYLSLIEALMMATEELGVGRYKPHNSLVPTSTVDVKIDNDVTYGNDVFQTFVKKMPANLTLFEFLEELSQKFKFSVCEICLQEKNGVQWPEKWNGLTLEELKINGKNLKAVKSSKDKIRKENLMENGKFTEKAKKAFEEIYNTFAVEGKMGRKECANFVSAVAKTSSSPYESRVAECFKEFDRDKDDNLTLEDFFDFYMSNCVQGKDEVVWRNLNNVRYRKDLKKYDDPVEVTNENLLFRSHLYKSEKFYNLLFSLCTSEHEELRSRCKRLLLRLPTFPKTVESVHSELDLISKDSFQTEYLLIAIQSMLNSGSHETNTKSKREFINSGNSTQIFDMMKRIDEIECPSFDENKCLIISLQILRSLLHIPEMRGTIENVDGLEVGLELMPTELFSKMALRALKNLDIETFEASMALQFTQNNHQNFLALEAIFHEELSIRKICCNWILINYVLNRSTVNLFQIEQKKNCEPWFDVLTKISEIDNEINVHEIVCSCLEKIKWRHESVEKNEEDQIIYGNLKIIWILVQRSKDKIPDIFNTLTSISSNIVSAKSRKLVYLILADFNVLQTISFLFGLIESVKPVREISAKNNFVGLKNLGNTCYLNSALQVLFYNNAFRNLILSTKEEEIMVTEVNGKSIIDSTVYQLKKMYENFLESTKKFYVPEDFCLTIKNGDGSPINQKLQEDAHEFVSKFLDKVEKFCEKVNKKETFHSIFEGKTITQILCKKCQNKIHREETFNQFTLSVEKLNNIKESFEKYIAPEIIEGYFCENCNEKVDQIERSTFLSKLPELFIVNLQRMVYDLHDFVFKKIDSKFEFPHELDITNYLSKESCINKEDCLYRLKSIIIHSGNSESGHYYSIVRMGEEWFKFNDQSVTKFDIKELPHEAFGGDDSQEKWGDDLKISTNAYILFYEKEEHSETLDENKREFEKEIKEENKVFYKQMQVHQESIFEICIEIFEKYHSQDADLKIMNSIFDENWSQHPNLLIYEATYELSIKLLKFATVFYDVKSALLLKIGQNLFKLFYYLPEKSYSFVTGTSADEFIDIMCLHPDDTIRQIYSTLLAKSIYIFTGYYQANFSNEEPGNVKLINLIDSLFAFWEDENLMKNINKIYFFIEFWKVVSESVPIFADYLARNETIAIIVNLFMANDSPFVDKSKKRVEIPIAYYPPLFQLLWNLIFRKKNLQGYLSPNKTIEGMNYYDMSEKEAELLGNMKLYEKMFESKGDLINMGNIIIKLSENDEVFSKKLVPFLLQRISKVSDYNSSIFIFEVPPFLFEILKLFLIIDDDFTSKRLKWILGIAQLRMGEDLVYGMTYEDESVVMEYLSCLYFEKSERDNYKPALAVLFDNRFSYTSFSITGVNLLLEIMINSQKAFNYVMSLPAPLYKFSSYIEWIPIFIKGLKESPFDFPNKEASAEQLNNMFCYLLQRTNFDSLSLPVNKKIIGINKELTAASSIENEDYSMTLWAHFTYVLPNLPMTEFNKSLPKELFKFGNPLGFAKCFISLSKSKEILHDEGIETDLSLFTLEINSRRKLTIKIFTDSFTEEIEANKGKVYINFPYCQIENIEDSIKLEVKEKEICYMEEKKEEERDQVDQYSQYGDFNMNEEMNYYDEYKCNTCTLINLPGAKMCEACGSYLN